MIHRKQKFKRPYLVHVVAPTGYSKANTVAPAGNRTARSLCSPAGLFSTYFARSPKIDTSQTKIQTTVSHPCGCPYGVFEGPGGCPCRCSNSSSLRSSPGFARFLSYLPQITFTPLQITHAQTTPKIELQYFLCGHSKNVQRVD